MSKKNLYQKQFNRLKLKLETKEKQLQICYQQIIDLSNEKDELKNRIAKLKGERPNWLQRLFS